MHTHSTFNEYIKHLLYTLKNSVTMLVSNESIHRYSPNTFDIMLLYTSIFPRAYEAVWLTVHTYVVES